MADAEALLANFAKPVVAAYDHMNSLHCLAC